jgi:metal-sulfur cluster biosynthetic enzyme
MSLLEKGETMPTQEEVYEVLRTCYDPEIPVNIVDLGLVYGVHIAAQKVDVTMTLTARGCGMGGYIASEAEQKLLELPGVEEAKVELVWDPPWEPSMISPEARKMLGMPEDD